METITEIVSFSHDGINHMWYPFSAKLDGNNSIISSEFFYEIAELLSLLKSMFATNNHSPEMVSKENIKGSRQFLVGENARRTECSVIFNTENNQYILRRCFFGNYSVEARLHRVNSSVVYFGYDVINMLRKFHKPFIVGEGNLFDNGSFILKPDTDHSRNSLVSLANDWARMVGFQDSRIELDYTGRWSNSGNFGLNYSKRNRRRGKMPSPLRLLTVLAQAVIRKRKFGKCPPILSPFNVESLNEFEAIAMLDLVKNISKEERIQFVIGINGKQEVNSMIDAIATPNLSIYHVN